MAVRGYGTSKARIRDILRRERQRAKVDEMLTEAIDSGESTPMTSRDWKRIRTEGLKRAAQEMKSCVIKKPRIEK